MNRQMTTDEHLNAILAKCKANLALAEKRTRGNWIKDIQDHIRVDGKVIASCNTGSILDEEKDANNAAFISACAGSAEAGWRSTVAAIEGLRAIAWYNDSDETDTSEGRMARKILASILSAWPIELL